MSAMVLPAPADATSSRLDGRAASRPAVDWLLIVQALVLVLLPGAIYWQALQGTFLWDDELLISDSPLVQSLSGLGKIWFSTVPLDYFPLSNTSFWIEWRLWGTDPLGYHLTNLALHLGSAFLFWRLLDRLRVPGAWFGALVFAIHPVNVASVAWIAERKNTLSMVFLLASLGCYVRAEEATDRRSFVRGYVVALGLFALALLSKSSVVMLPAVLLVLAWWRRGRLGRQDFERSAPFFALSLAAGWATMWFQYHKTMSAASLHHSNPLVTRALTAGRATFFYLEKIFWPSELSMIYPRWQIDPSAAVNYLWPLAAAALLAGAYSGRRWWGRGPFAALACFVVTLLPVSGLLHMSFFTYSYVSDHLVYVSMLAIVALVAGGLGALYAVGGRTGQLALVGMTAVIAFLTLGCIDRAGQFRDSEQLWRATLEINPDSAAAHNNLGVFFQNGGNLLLASAHLRKALELSPGALDVETNLANVLRMSGRYADSAAMYERVLKVEPNAQAFNNYGVALLELGENAKARQALQNALRFAPTMTHAYYNLYRLALNEHDLTRAGANLRACLRIDPGDVQALDAMVALNVEQPGTPALPPAAAEAVVALAERACALSAYNEAPSLALLSKALVAAGRRPEALAVGRKASSIALRDGQKDLAAGLDEYLRPLEGP